jgi:hypothetical protein
MGNSDFKCLLTKKLIYSEIVIAIYMQITCDSIVKILTAEREKSDFVI